MEFNNLGNLILTVIMTAYNRGFPLPKHLDRNILSSFSKNGNINGKPP